MRAAGAAVRPSGAWGRRPPAKPANEVSPDAGTPAAAPRRVSASHCEAFLEFIELSLATGRNAKAIWHDLVLETRLRQAQAEPMAPIDLISCLVSDELTRRADGLLERRRKQAGFEGCWVSIV